MAFGWLRRRWLWGLAPAALIGAAAGAAGLGGFNAAMEATNSTAFCISCHEMRSTVHEEHRASVHYRNASGVRAECADCHVPRDWTRKVVRKIQAAGELYHWLAGSIDTPEEFAAKRHELAARVWDQMRASDSRECRNCHSFEAMDFNKQSPKAARAMKDAMEAGKTCIDCHKGVAHTMPDVTAGHRRLFAELTAAAAGRTPAPGDTVFALEDRAFHLERPADGEAPPAPPDGEIAAAAPVRVLAVEGAFAQVALDGWMREGTATALYARHGKRMALARLETAAAAAGIEPKRAVSDPETGWTWTAVRLVVWTRAEGYIASQASLWDYGARMYAANCSLCHAAHAPDAYAANAWIGHMNAMKRLTPLTDAEARLLLAYLQSHAKDAAAAER